MKQKTYLVVSMCLRKDGNQMFSNDSVTCKHKKDAWEVISFKYNNDEDITGCICLNIICLDD